MPHAVTCYLAAIYIDDQGQARRLVPRRGYCFHSADQGKHMSLTKAFLYLNILCFRPKGEGTN